MKGPDVKTASMRSGPEAPIPGDPESIDFMTGELDADQGLRDRGGHAEAIATLRLLWENRAFLVRVTGAAMALCVVVALLIPSRYQSVTRLMPPDSQSGSGLAMAAAALSGGGSGMGGLGGMAGELLGLKSTSDLLVGVLGSRTVQDGIIQKFDLRKVYSDRRMEDARRHLAARTDVSVDRKSQIISIGVTDRSPQRAAAMAQAYSEELNRTLADVSMSSARRERTFLEGRLQGVRRDLEASEKAFSQFASKNTAIDIKEQGKAMVDAAATLQGQLIAARSEVEGLRQIYADGNVRVRSAEAKVAELEDQLKRVGGKDESVSAGNGTQDDSLYPSIRKLPLLGVTYADLYRTTKIQEAIFETLTQEYELAKVQEAKEIPTVKVLDPPNIPERKSFPPRTFIVLLGGALALCCGVVWILGRKAWEQTSPTDPGKVLVQEVLGSVMAALPWTSRNGHALHAENRGIGEHGSLRDDRKQVDK
ncbi:MAG: GumC family protein [Terriglobia bacterium]